jgi:ribosome-binding factor A
MSTSRRIQRVNSLLKEVLSEVLARDLENQNLPEFLTVIEVDTTKDLRYAKVYISLITADPKAKTAAIERLQILSGYIAILASKKVSLRYFPALTFKIDESADKYMQIDDILKKVGQLDSEIAKSPEE